MQIEVRHCIEERLTFWQLPKSKEQWSRRNNGTAARIPRPAGCVSAHTETTLVARLWFSENRIYLECEQMRDPYNRIGEDELIYQVFRMHDRFCYLEATKVGKDLSRMIIDQGRKDGRDTRIAGRKHRKAEW